jgi:flagellar basal-body rod protein FlgB
MQDEGKKERKETAMGVWVEGLLQRESLPVLESAMGFAFQRHLNIMNNIANVETPYYKRKVLPEEKFSRIMQEALDRRYQNHWNKFEPRGEFGVDFYGVTRPAVRNMEGQEWGPERHDENNVVIEKEMSDLAKNAAYMEALQQLYRNKTDGLKAALRDRVA